MSAPSHPVPRRSAWFVLASVAGLIAPEDVRAQDAFGPAPATVTSDHADWSGPYGGIAGSAGGGYGRYRFKPFALGGVPVRDLGSAFSDASPDLTSWNAGGFAGYNWQAGSIVFGLEGHGGTALLKRAVTGLPDEDRELFRAKRGVTGSARTRIGFAFDDYLLYGAAGLAFADHRIAGSGVPEIPGSGRRPTVDAGFTYGFGIETAITPYWSVGIDYQRTQFAAARGAFDLGGIVRPRGRIDTDDVVARLTYHPYAMRLAREPEEREGERADWSIHGQTTFIQQAVPRFRSPYIGPFSFRPEQSREIWTLTAFLGRRLWDGAELYFNPELNQGFGPSSTLGIAGFVNGEAQKAGAPYPKFRPQRYFVRQTFGLGGETEDVPDGFNQIAGSRDVDRVTLTVGKFAVGDFFDDNAYAHDPRTTFNNWSLWASSAYDAPANLPGFTQGAVLELNRKDWAVRGGLFQVPKEPNSDVLDPRITRKGGGIVEFEGRFSLWDQPGKIRLGAFSNVGRTADYRLALAVADFISAPDPNDAALLTRRDRRKSGVYANLEKAITDDLGFFARASYNDGKAEILSFTDVDRSLSGGFALKGSMWDRPKDTIGIGTTYNMLSRPHRDFLAAGGLGLLIGDGRLNYRPERALEAYYKVNLTTTLDLTFDYQLVVNPGYNADRGPVNVVATRLHAEF